MPSSAKEAAKQESRSRKNSSRSRNASESATDKCNKIVITSLSQPQMVAALDRFQLILEPGFTNKDFLKLLSCNKVWMGYFDSYESDQILAVFDKFDDCVDFTTKDGKVKGIFWEGSSGKVYPCCVCSDEITKEDDEDDNNFGILCSDCGEYFHNGCVGERMSRDLNVMMKNSPRYVKVLCPSCDLKHEKILDKLSAIEDKCKQLDTKLNSMGTNSGTFSAAVSNNKFGNKSNNTVVQLPRSVVKSLSSLTKANAEEDEAARLKRTRVVIRPENTGIRDSRDIRKEFNKHYKGEIISHCRVTAGGAIMFEFEDEDTAVKVNSAWKESYFGGNKGMKIPGESNSVGLIKYVYDDIDVKEIEKEIIQKYPDATCDFFKRKSDGKFSGMVKVDFGSRTMLQDAIAKKIVINQQRYIVEEFIRKSRVVKCNKCQGWGHIHRYCTKEAKCGKCAGDHETKTCQETNLKCCHCSDSHRAGSSECKVYKEKTAQFSVNSNYYDQ